MSEKNVEETNSLLDEMHIYLWSNMNESPTTMYNKVVGRRDVGASDLARSRPEFMWTYEVFPLPCSSRLQIMYDPSSHLLQQQ